MSPGMPDSAAASSSISRPSRIVAASLGCMSCSTWTRSSCRPSASSSRISGVSRWNRMRVQARTRRGTVASRVSGCTDGGERVGLRQLSSGRLSGGHAEPNAQCRRWAGPRLPAGACSLMKPSAGETGRGERIRTSDLCVPNATLYQAEPRPDQRIDAAGARIERGKVARVRGCVKRSRAAEVRSETAQATAATASSSSRQPKCSSPQGMIARAGRWSPNQSA